MQSLIIGAGFSGLRIAQLAQAHGAVHATRRTAEGVQVLLQSGVSAQVFDGVIDEGFDDVLHRATHLFICVPPARELPLQDPVLSALRDWLSQPRARSAATACWQWIGYLSTIGVYGNHDGAWVDESTPCRSQQTRSLARREAEVGWQLLARELGIPISILRLSGIYGPGRNAVKDAIAGRARMLIKPGQFFNRIHVDDLARAAVQAARQAHDGVLNITDDMPAAPQDVIRHAHALVGKPAPEAVAFDSAELSPMARSFYSENKRVRNALSKSVLGFDYHYPSYREGLDAIWRAFPAGREISR